MLSSNVSSFAEPEEFASSIQNTDAVISLTNRGLFVGDISRIAFHSLNIQRVSVNLPHVLRLVPRSGRTYAMFQANPVSDVCVGGTMLAADGIVQLAADEPLALRTSGPAGFGCMSLPSEEIHVVGCDLTASRQ